MMCPDNNTSYFFINSAVFMVPSSTRYHPADNTYAVTNHHVNNCQYICMAEDFLPEDFKVYQMRAEYKMQAKLGDIICPKVKAETGKVIVSLDDTDGKAYAIIEFQQK